MATEQTDEQSAMPRWRSSHAHQVDPVCRRMGRRKDPSARDAETGRGTGMGGLTVRVELGGSGLGHFDSTIIFEAVVAGCPRVAAFLSIHNRTVWMIDAFGSRGFRKQVVPNLTSMEHCKLLPHRARFGFGRHGIADAGGSRRRRLRRERRGGLPASRHAGGQQCRSQGPRRQRGCV
jgi:hypothetical protein